MKILFQGDSITDCGRNRANMHNLGSGYPKLVAKTLTEKYPNTSFEFINLGISGNRTYDLVDRWQADCIDLNPDIISIMIGVNDVWHVYAHGTPMTIEQFERNYRLILTEIKEKTNAKILMIEPYLFYVEDKPFRELLNPVIDVVRKLAFEFADLFVDLDGAFVSAAIEKPKDFYTLDGVHPTLEGAKFIANRYLNAIEKLL